MVANLTAASTAITGSNDLACATSVTDAIPGLLALAYAVLAESSTEAMEETFECGFFRTNLDAVVEPSLKGSVRDATGAVSVCLVLAGIFGLLLVVTLIAQQIIFGDVGIEPGCPSCLRCCCCYTPGKNAAAGRLGSGGEPPRYLGASPQASREAFAAQHSVDIQSASTDAGGPTYPAAPAAGARAAPTGLEQKTDIPVVEGRPFNPSPWSVESV